MSGRLTRFACLFFLTFADIKKSESSASSSNNVCKKHERSLLVMELRISQRSTILLPLTIVKKILVKLFS